MDYQGDQVTSQAGLEISKAWRAAAQVGRFMADLEARKLRDAARTNRTSHTSLARKIERERRVAERIYRNALDKKWWDSATMEQGAYTYGMATRFSQIDPVAAQAVKACEMEAKERWGIDLTNPEELPAEFMTVADMARNMPLLPNEPAGNLAEEALFDAYERNEFGDFSWQKVGATRALSILDHIDNNLETVQPWLGKKWKDQVSGWIGIDPVVDTRIQSIYPGLIKPASAPAQYQMADQEIDKEQATAAPAQRTPQQVKPELESLSAESKEMLAKALPAPMQKLSEQETVSISNLIQERVDGGWTVKQIHDVLNANPLPSDVHSVAGFTSWALKKHVDPENAPSQREKTPASTKPSSDETERPLSLNEQATRAYGEQIWMPTWDQAKQDNPGASSLDAIRIAEEKLRQQGITEAGWIETWKKTQTEPNQPEISETEVTRARQDAEKEIADVDHAFQESNGQITSEVSEQIAEEVSAQDTWDTLEARHEWQKSLADTGAGSQEIRAAVTADKALAKPATKALRSAGKKTKVKKPRKAANLAKTRNQAL